MVEDSPPITGNKVQFSSNLTLVKMVSLHCVGCAKKREKLMSQVNAECQHRMNTKGGMIT